VFMRLFDPRSRLILTRPVNSRRSILSAAVGGHDPSSVAFTFAPANDVHPKAPEAETAS
jgi:poly(3-hydroxybutyrate) depolymerase